MPRQPPPGLNPATIAEDVARIQDLHIQAAASAELAVAPSEAATAPTAAAAAVASEDASSSAPAVPMAVEPSPGGDAAQSSEAVVDEVSDSLRLDTLQLGN